MWKLVLFTVLLSLTLGSLLNNQPKIITNANSTQTLPAKPSPINYNVTQDQVNSNSSNKITNLNFIKEMLAQKYKELHSDAQGGI